MPEASAVRPRSAWQSAARPDSTLHTTEASPSHHRAHRCWTPDVSSRHRRTASAFNNGPHVTAAADATTAQPAAAHMAAAATHVAAAAMATTSTATALRERRRRGGEQHNRTPKNREHL